MSSENALSRWLQATLPERGYPLHGPRAGGISRLAKDAGIPQPTASRLVNGIGEPTLDSLRKVGKVLGRTLGEMMIVAELATPDELATRGERDSQPPPDWSHPPADFPKGIPWSTLPIPARQAWHFDLSVKDRRLISRLIVELVDQEHEDQADCEDPPSIRPING